MPSSAISVTDASRESNSIPPISTQYNFPADLTDFLSSDLLNAHLRRHEKRGHSASAPAQGETASPSTAAEMQDSPSEPSPSESQPPAQQDENNVHPRQEYPPSRPYPHQYPPMALPPPQHLHSGLQQYSPETTGSLPQSIQQGFMQAPMAETEDDGTWLFPGTSLFDLPPDEYLNLHFGGALGPGSPVCVFRVDVDSPLTTVQTMYAQSIQSLAPPLEIPRFTPADHERMLNECPVSRRACFSM